MRRSIPAVIALAVSALTISVPLGCSGSTTGGTAYSVTVTRHVEAYIAHNHETIYNAALPLLEETFRYSIERSDLDGRTGVIRAKTAKDNTVTFEVTRDSDKMSKVSVFAGPFGDVEAARDILSRLEARLKKSR